MIIIGEKINGAIPSVAEAIKNRDSDFIRNLVKHQVDAGVDYLDVCAGTRVEEELEALNWLLDIVQKESNMPICIDSPNAKIIESVLPRIKQNGLINSVSGEGEKCEVIYPLMQGNDWKVIALTCHDGGIPSTVQEKVEVAFMLIDKASKYGIGPERIFIDPLVMALAAVNDSMISFMAAVQEIKRLNPKVKTVSGLSNISFGMPCRKLINLNFLTLALYAGMDAAIIDPTNKDLYATVFAVEALLDRDKYCRRYYSAYRKGKFGAVNNVGVKC